MKRVLFYILVQFMCWLTETGRVKRVIQGIEVPCGSQPRVLSLRNSTNLSHLCGATLLSPKFAVTAAHCVHFAEKNYVLQANNYCNNGGTEYLTAKVLEIITNRQYDRQTRAHDIALLRITLDLDDITSLVLNDIVLPSSAFGQSGSCIVYGYGYRNIITMEISENLLAGRLEIVSLDECTEKLGPFVAPQFDSGMLCAVGDGVDTCQGDSGSPLVCLDNIIQGVSSYGMSCGVPELPGVYTSIGAHLDWIRDCMQNNAP